jgi:aryl-alcohol dehydrogenase-like predicted oxidoreductase
MKLSLEASLKKLGTTYIDLFYVHWWDYSATIPEIMHSLNDLVVSGKVLYLGISDTPAWLVSMANEYARTHGLRPFSVYQGMWNASMRDFERDIIPMCQHQGMALAPYGVLNQGRFQTAEGFRQREKHNPGRNFIATSDRDKQVSRVLEELGNAKGVDLLNVALAYVMQKTPYVFPIVGQRKVEHLKGSIAALLVSLEEEEIGKIEFAYEFDHGFPHTFLSGTLFDGSTPRQVQGPGDVWLTKSGGNFDWVETPKAIRLRQSN